MIKKLRFLILMLLFTPNLVGQNLASSLYEIDYFPKEMQFATDFINETCNDILIYNFVPFSFELKGKQPFEIPLPLKDKFSIRFNHQNNDASEITNVIQYEHQFLLASLQPTYEISDAMFTLPFVFQLAVEYFKLSEYDILPELTKMRKDLRTYDDYFHEQLIYFAEIAEDYGVESSIYEGFKENVNIETLTIREIDELLVDTLLDHLSDDQIDTLIDTFFRRQIFEKFTTEKTQQVMDYLFNREDVVGIIEAEVLQPKVSISLSEGAFLNIPKNLLVSLTDDEHNFPIESVHIRIDFKEHKMQIEFKSKNLNKLEIKKAAYFGSKIKNKIIETKLLCIEVSKGNNVLKINDFREENTTYIVELK